MKTGKTLTQLAMEIERQQAAKQDFVASTTAMRMQNDELPGGPALQLGERDFGINEIGHDQIGAHTGIPAKYYDKMRVEAPDLLASNVNRWFDKYPAPRMVRTLDGKVRAFLSDSYRPLENADLAEAVLPILTDLNMEIMSCEITERRLYIKAVDKRIERDVPTGRQIGDGSHVFFDTCSPAAIISNSEVGLGQLSIDTGVFTRVCTNLATFASAGMKKRHVGAKSALDGEEIRHLLTDETKRATDRAVWMQVRDVLQGAFDEARFSANVDRMMPLAAQRIDGDPIKVVELSAKRIGATEGESTSILRHLIAGGDLTRYGLFNAVTRTAQDIESYDRASEFERMGGALVELPANEWRELAKAA